MLRFIWIRGRIFETLGITIPWQWKVNTTWLSHVLKWLSSRTLISFTLNLLLPNISCPNLTKSCWKLPAWPHTGTKQKLLRHISAFLLASITVRIWSCFVSRFMNNYENYSYLRSERLKFTPLFIRIWNIIPEGAWHQNGDEIWT